MPLESKTCFCRGLQVLKATHQHQYCGGGEHWRGSDRKKRQGLEDVPVPEEAR